MATIDCIQAMIAYNYALYERVWDSMMQLTDAQFVQEVLYSHGSLRNQMVHVTAVDGRWLRGLQGAPDARQFTLNPHDFPTRADVRTVWDATAQEIQAYVATLDDASLDQQPPGMNGPVWHVLMHMVNHGTDHRAQILRLLHDFNAPSFDQDLIFYLWRR